MRPVEGDLEEVLNGLYVLRIQVLPRGLLPSSFVHQGFQHRTQHVELKQVRLVSAKAERPLPCIT